jgi:hypothetical protein
MAATIAVAVVSGCAGVLVGTEEPATRSGTFEAVWTAVDRYYAGFAPRSVDWEAVGDQYRPAAAAASDDAALYQVLAGMIGTLNDPHVELALPSGQVLRSRDPAATPTWFSATTIVTRYLPGYQLSQRHGIIYGQVGAGIGYLWIPTFRAQGWVADVDDILASFGNPGVVIVDVRNNTGGYSRNAEATAARFTSHRLRFGAMRYRDGLRHDEFTAPRDLAIEPAGPRQFSGPVIVLTNRRTVSAAEHFLLAMRARANTTVLGDTTMGAMGIPLPRELPGNLLLTVPYSIEYDAGGVTHEAAGVAPTITAPHSAADSIAGRDPQLEAAIALATATAQRARHGAPRRLP